MTESNDVINVTMASDLKLLRAGATDVRNKLTLLKEPESINEDFEVARTNIYRLMGVSEKLLNMSIDLCNGSEAPRAFEVAGQLFNNAVDINTTLLELQKKYKSEEPKNSTTNNNLYIGTTEDMQTAIEKVLTGDKKNDKKVKWICG